MQIFPSRKERELPTRRATVAIVGGGIAGVWVGIKLARAGVPTVLITYSGDDRGGITGSTAKSVGAINTTPLERSDFAQFLDVLGQHQVHPDVAAAMTTYLPAEVSEICSIGSFKKIKLGIALAGANTKAFLHKLYRRFEEAGGQIIDGWVTRLVADEMNCSGIQYQLGQNIGKLIAPVVIIASGGYTGLFDGSVTTNNYGSMLGRFLECGGLATNLEFIFKHGYGKPDLGALTPTEELPGAEIYDDSGTHVEWLEKELFEGRGTANHLEAFKHWRRNHDKQFFIDLSYCEVYRKIIAFNRLVAQCPSQGEADRNKCIDAILAHSDAEQQQSLRSRLTELFDNHTPISYEIFKELKSWFNDRGKGHVFRVRQIAYFSMGGIAHRQFRTNLANVYVTGEAMHDFGAHRIGGLPWGLYLASGKIISDSIIADLNSGNIPHVGDFDLQRIHSQFEEELLHQIRVKLYRHQESHFNVVEIPAFVEWLRRQRRQLRREARHLDDGVAWLNVAEAVMAASARRLESRGCFYREDHPQESDALRSQFTVTWYDFEADIMVSELRSADLFHSLNSHSTGVDRDVIANSQTL